MAEITRTFDEPYYTAGGSSGVFTLGNLGGSLVAINGNIYPIDTAADTYGQTALTVVDQRNTTDSRDILLLPQNVWREQVQSWNYGSGQSNMDRDDTIRGRYRESFGVDPWTKWQLSLLPEVAALQVGLVTHPSMVTTHNGQLAVVYNNTINWYSDFDTVSFTATAGTVPITQAIDAGSLYMLNTSGEIWKSATPGATPTLWYTNAAIDNISFVKDYMIAAIDNTLFNITDPSSPVLIYTAPDPAFRWVGGCEGMTSIYMAGGVGDTHVVHSVGIKQDGTGLEPTTVAVMLPDGESIASIGSYLGFVFIGTGVGVRMAGTNASNGSLLLGPIIPTGSPVKCFEGQDRFVWYGRDVIEPGYTTVGDPDTETLFPTSTVSGLGRMDLSAFTTGTLSPAYANDICSWTTAAGLVTSVCTFLGERVYSVSGQGVYRGTGDRVAGGWITQGSMSFSVEDSKAALYMQAKWLPSIETKINIDLSFDSGAFVRYANLLTSVSTVRSDNLDLAGAQFSRVDMRMVLLRSPVDNKVGPNPTRWELRAFPVKGRASKWIVPVVIADDVDISGAVSTRDVVKDKENLVSLVTNGTVFMFQESGKGYQVLARNFEWKPQRLSTTGNGWQGTLTMSLEEVM